jgi:hypothetical protein
MTRRFHVMFTACAMALAGLQGLHAADLEVFGGFTVGKLKTDSDTKSASMSGWNGTMTAYATSRFGITADFAGYYGTAKLTTADSSTSVTTRQYSFMGGPQVRLFQKGRLETSVRGLVGAAYGYIPGPGYSSYSQTSLAALVGTNVDLRLSRRVSMRFSPGLYITTFGDQTQKSFRFSVGPVFRFGGES